MQCFLSYARENKDRADKLYIRMRQMGLSVWMDQSPAPYPNKGIPPGTDWDSFIARRIAESDVFLPLFSDERLDPDRYFHSELMAAFTSHVKGSNPTTIIPILIGADRAPVLDGEADFAKFQWIDLDKLGDGATARLIAAQVAPAGETQEIAISSADELLQCLGPNRRIILSAGDYDITAVAEKVADFPFLARERVYDGVQLIIKDLENVALVNAQGARPHLHVSPAYAFPLMFRHCSGVTIEGLRIGHFPQEGSCVGGVIALHDCRNVQIVDTELYGCGTVGLEIVGGDAIYVERCVIEKCNTGFATIDKATNVSMRETIVRDNKAVDGIVMSNADGVTISGCTFERNVSWDHESEGRLIETNGSPNVVIENSTFVENGLRFDLEQEPNVRLQGNRFARS
jgi:TIR domain-containing protein/parallel beta helix pectate lyase-like protein